MPPSVCRTLLDDGMTRCLSTVRPGRQSCSKHAAVYDASYEGYKGVENAAKLLRAAAQTKRSDVHTIPAGETGPRIDSIQKYLDALELELKLRMEHDARFIGSRESHGICFLQYIWTLGLILDAYSGRRT